MLRNVSTALTIGLVVLGEAGIVVSQTPSVRTADSSASAVSKQRVPQSRLVKFKRLQTPSSTSIAAEPAPVRPPTIAQAASGKDARSRLIRTAPTVDPLGESAPGQLDPLDLDPPTPSRPTEPAQEGETLPTPQGTAYRLEPPSKLIPVAADELKPGVIYLHDDPEQRRQAWSFVQADGTFWHAFGPGTTQALVHFDLRMTDEEALEALRKIDPKLAFNVTNQGTRVFLRLQPDNTWKLVRISSVPSIYDLVTSRRWEKQWGHYVPVTHERGDTWIYRDGQYWAPHWTAMMRPSGVRSVSRTRLPRAGGVER